MNMNIVNCIHTAHCNDRKSIHSGALVLYCLGAWHEVCGGTSVQCDPCPRRYTSSDCQVARSTTARAVATALYLHGSCPGLGGGQSSRLAVSPRRPRPQSSRTRTALRATPRSPRYRARDSSLITARMCITWVFSQMQSLRAPLGVTVILTLSLEPWTVTTPPLHACIIDICLVRVCRRMASCRLLSRK